MDHSLKNLTALLDHLSQPVFCVREGTVCYCNAAAADRLVCVGAPIERYLDADPALFDTDAEAQQLPVVLAGQQLRATVQKLTDGQLFLVTPDAGEGVHGDALRTVAQSLRTPLSNLFGVAAELFPELEELEQPALQRQMSCVNRALYQLLHLACNLSDMSAVLSDTLRLAREKVELSAWFSELLGRAEPFCRTMGVELNWQTPSRQFYGWIDCQRVERAFWNLLSNALKFTPKGGTVCVHLENTGKTAMLRFSDNGEGLSAPLLATAFARYDRRSQLNDPRWGAGFGLPLVQKIAQLHGGTVVIQSQEDTGTSVSMTLSLQAPDCEEMQLHSPVASMDYTGGYRHDLVELADILPLGEFDSYHIN